MTEKDARAVLGIMVGADGDCPNCGRRLLRVFCERWPEFKTVAVEVFAERHKDFGDKFDPEDTDP
jgi:uncharacterized protein (DUF983 family)